MHIDHRKKLLESITQHGYALLDTSALQTLEGARQVKEHPQTTVRKIHAAKEWLTYLSRNNHNVVVATPTIDEYTARTDADRIQDCARFAHGVKYTRDGELCSLLPPRVARDFDEIAHGLQELHELRKNIVDNLHTVEDVLHHHSYVALDYLENNLCEMLPSPPEKKNAGNPKYAHHDVVILAHAIALSEIAPVTLATADFDFVHYFDAMHRDLGAHARIYKHHDKAFTLQIAYLKKNRARIITAEQSMFAYFRQMNLAS